ncbi:hypothetical protein LY78DRAFT_697911 [Colletotrichum sublineola]|nr:hypothetical protein LY78DRAFT_697911 [Colletotrichum sublineola]
MTNATFFSALKRLSLLVLVLSQVSLLAASPAPPALPSPDDGSLPKRAARFSDDYEGRVKKGEHLRSLMPLDNAGAAKANGASVAGPFQDPSAAARWGWTLKTSWYPFRPGMKPPQTEYSEEAYKDPAFPVEYKQSGVYEYYHDKEFAQAGGNKGAPTMAVYSNVVNPSAGAFIFDANMSPRYIVEEYSGVGTMPDLHTLSDLAFFQWVEGCRHKKASPKSLKVVFRTHITYEPTFALVMQALKEAGHKRVPGWRNRATFKMGTRQGDAILGSTHGSGVAWMLIQHKDALGVKEIAEAVVWGHQPRTRKKPGSPDGFEFTASPDSVDLNIRFTIRNA